MKLQDMTEDVKIAVIYSRRDPPIRAGGGWRIKVGEV